MKFVAKLPDPDPVSLVELVEHDEGSICLKVGGFYVLRITAAGTLQRIGGVDPKCGVKVTTRGVIILSTDDV